MTSSAQTLLSESHTGEGRDPKNTLNSLQWEPPGLCPRVGLWDLGDQEMSTDCDLSRPAPPPQLQDIHHRD